jgi:hypothetical protein
VCEDPPDDDGSEGVGGALHRPRGVLPHGRPGLLRQGGHHTLHGAGQSSLPAFNTRIRSDSYFYGLLPGPDTSFVGQPDQEKILLILSSNKST